jgi:hypothetical protein
MVDPDHSPVPCVSSAVDGRRQTQYYLLPWHLSRFHDAGKVRRKSLRAERLAS